MPNSKEDTFLRQEKGLLSKGMSKYVKKCRNKVQKVLDHGNYMKINKFFSFIRNTRAKEKVRPTYSEGGKKDPR